MNPEQSVFTDDMVNRLILLLRIERALQERAEGAVHASLQMTPTPNGGYDMKLGNINYWFLETIPDLLQDLADETTTHPANLTLEEWKETLERMVFLFREANLNTCVKYKDEIRTLELGDSVGDSFEEIQAYLDTCKTEALTLFNEYFWELDG